ncbi:MAG: hypothetical protein Q8P25_00055 [Candidatus Curtissbacteria bacterium]|nr:hypothetical protein [Candidatus Curtissbacteria bacterium]
MPALPRLNLVQSAKCLVFSRIRLSLFIIISLFTIHYSLFTGAVRAADAPNPQPCKNPIETEQKNLTDNYITDSDGKALQYLRWEGDRSLIVEGTPGEQVFLPPVTFTFKVDFSKLQSLFADTNSNYLEGNFQSSQHSAENITSLNSQNFNSFHGALQKATPKIMLDEQKKNYVTYVYNKPTLPEAANKYTDIDGNGPQKTIYGLVTDFGPPNPPTSSSSEEERQQWLQTWGKYWEKIPTAWSEFYEGEIAFHWVVGNKGLETLKKQNVCPQRTSAEIIKFVLPEFYRTTAISDQLNRLFVARAAQSYQDHGTLQAVAPNPVAKAFNFCWELIKNSTTNLKKVVKISLDIINPVKVANAAEENKSCLKPLDPGKEGEAPYCPLPFAETAKLGVSCPTNKNDSNKLEKDNPNVVCTFTQTFIGSVIIDPESTVEKNPETAVFDSCEALPDSRYRCKVPLQIFPNIRIPWLAAIWNNTLYSDEAERLSNQETGRPGIFGNFITKSIQDPVETDLSVQEIVDLCFETNGQDPLCQELAPIWEDCFVTTGDYGGCIFDALKLPANVQVEDEIKERFTGGVDVNKSFVRECSLLPKAVREALNIKNKCK